RAHASQVPLRPRLMRRDIQDQPRQNRFRLGIPEYALATAATSNDQHLREQPRIVERYIARRVDQIERIVRCPATCNAERIERMHRPTNNTPTSRRHRIVLPLRIGHDERARVRQNVGNHDADTLTRPCRRDRQQMTVARITQRLVAPIASNQYPITSDELPRVAPPRRSIGAGPWTP